MNVASTRTDVTDASTNAAFVGDSRRGLLLGPFHPDFEEDQKQRRAALTGG